MSFAKNFTDLSIWQKGVEIIVKVHELTGKPPLGKDFVLVDQMRRAALSISSNIAEGFERKSKKDFAHFLTMSKASVGELRSQFYVVERLKKVDFQTNADMQNELIYLGNQIGAFIRSLRA